MGLLFLQMRRIEHDQRGKLPRRGGHNDGAAKTALGEQRQSPAMIEVGMRQQHKVNSGGVKPEVAGISSRDLTATLIKAAIDQDALARAFDEVTRTGHVAMHRGMIVSPCSP